MTRSFPSSGFATFIALAFTATAATAQFQQNRTGDLAETVYQHERRLSALETQVHSQNRNGIADRTDRQSMGTTSPSVPTPSPATVVYRVKPGESLGQIARRNSISATDLARINGLKNPDHVSAGQILRIPNQNRTAAEFTRPGQPSGSVSDFYDPAPEPAPIRTSTDHVVRKGETLYRIASQHGVTTAAIRESNGLFNDQIHIGQRLRIPAEFAPVSTATPHGDHRHSSTHTVAPHETASAIARRYGISVDDLARANNIANPAHIYPGQSLTIPGYHPQGLDGLTPATPARKDSFANYRVRKGNTITSIAREFEISPQAILDANGLSRNDTIQVGQDLKIPVDQFWATLTEPQ